MTENPDHEGKAAKPLPSFRLRTLKKRREFTSANGGPRFSTRSFTMLRRPISDGEAAQGIRFGFTVTKKVGNAVVRNRIRRRLREAVRAASGRFPSQAMDLVILARASALEIDFAAMVRDLAQAVETLARRGERKAASAAPAAIGKPRNDGNPVLS